MVISLLWNATTFLASFLLFQIQPICARQLLPLHGGSAAVWSACILFFQALLLAGYAYSHQLQRLPFRQRAVVHCVLLFVAAVTLPAHPADPSPSGVDAVPALEIIRALFVTIGLSFFTLSSTSPLIQSWSSLGGDQTPYRLYVTSNIAALGALLTYPFLVEPRLALHAQFEVWKRGFLLFTLLCTACALVSLFKHDGRKPIASEGVVVHPSVASGVRSEVIPWIAWPFLGSVLLLGFTSYICRDVAVIPFLWILPLSLYLGSFVLCFANRPLYHRNGYAALFLVGALLYSVPWTGGVRAPAWLAIPVCSFALFTGLMIAHGELALRKPHRSRLTEFYLSMSLGGALGGLAVTFAAPFLFKSYFELPLAVAVLATVALLRLMKSRPARSLRRALMITQATTIAFAFVPPFVHTGTIVQQSRNFYGTIMVRRTSEIVSLTDGRIEHGIMYLDEARRLTPAGYYAPDSGIGLAFARIASRSIRNIAVIGVGAGTVAAYSKPGDSWFLFELNPDVKTAAETHFDFLPSIRGRYEMILGDGRINLARTETPPLDLIMLDAFSSDSIPVHLLTREAVRLYLDRLRSDGLLVVHISNGHIRFEPLMAVLAADFGLNVRIVDSMGDGAFVYPATYAVFSYMDMEMPQTAGSRSHVPSIDPRVRVWTDDYSNLFQLLNLP